jgi:2-dehydro-3-deoxy-D-arabinonate dehydratase
MRLIKYLAHTGEPCIGQLDGDLVVPLDLARSPFRTLADILDAEDPEQAARALLDPSRETPATDVGLLAPIDRQEVWAAGVTYRRSQAARMEESAAAIRRLGRNCFSRRRLIGSPDRANRCGSVRIPRGTCPSRRSRWC